MCVGFLSSFYFVQIKRWSIDIHTVQSGYRLFNCHFPPQRRRRHCHWRAFLGAYDHHYMADILPIRRKTLFKQLINIDFLWNKAITRRVGPLYQKGSLSCHTCCDTGLRFLMSRPKHHLILSLFTTNKLYWMLIRVIRRMNNYYLHEQHQFTSIL